LGIAKSLDQENRFAWFRVVAQNQSFWSQMSFQLNDLLSMPIEEVKSLRKYSYRILKLFLALGNDKK
jgi:hypothetical protein